MKCRQITNVNDNSIHHPFRNVKLLHTADMLECLQTSYQNLSFMIFPCSIHISVFLFDFDVWCNRLNKIEKKSGTRPILPIFGLDTMNLVGHSLSNFYPLFNVLYLHWYIYKSIKNRAVNLFLNCSTKISVVNHP